MSNCLYRNKYSAHLDSFEINCYDSTTGLPVDCSTCESCPDYQTECYESREWTYSIDNAGTTYDWPNAEYQLTLSDGSTINWVQTAASNGGWTQQLTEWANNLQASADAAGLQWFVEPRAVNNPNPSDISGNYGSTPTGLPGAPSIPVAEYLVANGMIARYLNIQICPGQPVPVSGTVISHEDSPRFGSTYDNGGRIGAALTTAGAILGPISKFKVCVECGESDDLWYIFDKDIDGYREATAGEIPNCWEPCGTLSLTDAPPDRDCEFFIDLACDDNGDNANQAGFTNQITRRATVCNGEQISLEYFEEDPDDPAALVPYTLVGDFVDCTTGEIIPLPLIDGIVVECDADPISESYDSDVRIIGSKHPLPVFITDDCCVTPANLECIKKRTFDFVYDNGFTPGSSTNDGGERNNLVRFNWAFTSQGWETGAGVVGIGDAIGAYTGWSPQLTGWSTFGNTHDPYNSVSAFNFYGAPTWRGWSVTGCNPAAKYGVWTILREDGVTFKVYPTLYTETIERVYRSHETDCDGNITTRYWDINEDGKTYTEIDTPDDIECFVSCDYIFENVILPGAESPCTTTDQVLCDRVDPDDPSQDVQFVQVKTVCDGAVTLERYTLQSFNTATDPDGYVEYEVIGELFVCGTNEPPAEPAPECSDFVREILYSLEEPVTGTLRNREWHDTEPAISPFPQDAEAGRNFRENHDFSLPTTTDNTVSSLALNDTNNTAAKLDIQVIEGYIIVDKQLDLRYAGASEGYWAVELGKCCGELELIAENGGFSPDRNMPFTLPAGIHKIRLWNIDSGGSNSSANLQLSTDGGITYVTDNTPPGVQLSQTKPNELCKKVKICKDSGAFIDLLTDEVLDKSECYPCSKVCTPTPSCNCEGSGGAELPLTIRTIA